MSADKNNINEEKVVNKPITIARDEFIEKLFKATNESSLPIYMIEYVVRDFLNEVSRAANQLAEQERKQYQAEITKNESLEIEG